MYECDHQLVPVVYGSIYGDMLDKVGSNEVIYGGSRKTSGSPDWFCIKCLEEIYL